MKVNPQLIKGGPEYSWTRKGIQCFMFRQVVRTGIRLLTTTLKYFYTPYHLCHFEVSNSAARAVLFGDATIAPRKGIRVEVVAAAKRDLEEGEEVDGVAHYMTYGLCENADTSNKENPLPMGVAEGYTARRNIQKDQVLTYDDVKVPEGRLIDRLRSEQSRHFGP